MSTTSFGTGIAAMILSIPGAHAQTTAPGPYYATPSWDQQLPAASRFVVLSNWNAEAVLDRETGLVWQRTPTAQESGWSEAQWACAGAKTGGRAGWRLPSAYELSSLLDFSPAAGANGLPTGHPFIGISNGSLYFTSTSAGRNGQTQDLLKISFGYFGTVGLSSGGGAALYWCVRGAGGTPTLNSLTVL